MNHHRFPTTLHQLVALPHLCAIAPLRTLVFRLLALPMHVHAADALRVFYFGNSLTGATNPNWHEELNKSEGKQRQNWAWLGAGWQLWQHREELAPGKDTLRVVAEEMFT